MTDGNAPGATDYFARTYYNNYRIIPVYKEKIV